MPQNKFVHLITKKCNRSIFNSKDKHYTLEVKVSRADNLFNLMNTVSEELKELTLDAVFSESLLDQEKKDSIDAIKLSINEASDLIDSISIFSNDDIQMLQKVVDECAVSLHEIHSNMKNDLIQQNAEDEYGLLSAQLRYIHDQVERIKNS